MTAFTAKIVQAFELVSPKLRQTVYAGLLSGIDGLEFYSPYSYVCLVVALLICGIIVLNQGSRAR